MQLLCVELSTFHVQTAGAPGSGHRRPLRWVVRAPSWATAQEIPFEPIYGHKQTQRCLQTRCPRFLVEPPFLSRRRSSPGLGACARAAAWGQGQGAPLRPCLQSPSGHASVPRPFCPSCCLITREKKAYVWLESPEAADSGVSEQIQSMEGNAGPSGARRAAQRRGERGAWAFWGPGMQPQIRPWGKNVFIFMDAGRVQGQQSQPQEIPVALDGDLSSSQPRPLPPPTPHPRQPLVDLAWLAFGGGTPPLSRITDIEGPEFTGTIHGLLVRNLLHSVFNSFTGEESKAHSDLCPHPDLTASGRHSQAC